MTEPRLINISTHIPQEVSDNLDILIGEYRDAGLRITKWELISEGIVMAIASRREKLKRIEEVI